MSFNFPIPIDVLAWLAVMVFFLFIEATTSGLITIWFAGGAAVAAISAFLIDGLMWQILIFAVVSVALLYFTRPLALKKLENKKVPTNTDALAGQFAEVLSAVTERQWGTVRIDGKEWTAVLDAESEPAEVGDFVTVCRVEGVKLVVSKEKGETK